MATASVSTQQTGSIALTTTIAENYITLQGSVVALHVYLTDSAAGTFAFPAADSTAVPLPNSTWVEVWKRETRSGGPVTIYFAAASGTPTLSFVTRE